MCVGGLGKGGVGMCVDSRLCWGDWVKGEWGCVLTAFIPVFETFYNVVEIHVDAVFLNI